jgi:hypothetical protein
MSDGGAVAIARQHNAKSPAVAAYFHVEDWVACGFGLQAKDEWRAWCRGELATGAAPETQPVLPSLLRRRISSIGQMAFRAVYGLGATPRARFIFCSRHGEFQRTRTLIRTLAAGEPTSPADFSLSVHNALAGLLSIAAKNDAGHTAIAAGRDSFGFGLLEAASCLAARPEEAILLVYFDEPLPEEYATFRGDNEVSLALVLHLAPRRGDSEDVALSFERTNRTAPSHAAPQLALDFLRFLISGESERISISDRTQWRWCRAAA